MLSSSFEQAPGLYDRGDIAFLRLAMESAWNTLRFAVEDDDAPYAGDLRRRLVLNILRAIETGERSQTRIVDFALADLPPLAARYGANG
jgi:hypothetical protein